MGWRDALEAGELIATPSAYDSKRFGVSVDRITVSASAGTPLPEVLAAVERSEADVVVLRYPAREVGWFAALAVGERTALLADSLVYWSLPTGKGRRPAPLAGFTAGVETGIEDDLVDDLVGDIFGDYGNHHCANPLFDRGPWRAIRSGPGAASPRPERSCCAGRIAECSDSRRSTMASRARRSNWPEWCRENKAVAGMRICSPRSRMPALEAGWSSPPRATTPAYSGPGRGTDSSPFTPC
jgi:hypothetical protein